MTKDSTRKILVTFMAVSLVLSFSISSFAGYSFKEDGDAINEKFSGTNYVYTNGIYVGEMGAIDAYMDNYGNTYNGTNIIDATAYPGVGQDDESTYNGTLDVTANDIMSSKTTVDDATVNAVTTVNVNEVLADNDLNAGVQFNNSEFTKDVNITGSGDVSFDGATVNNVSIGSTQQAQTIVTNTGNTVSRLDQLINRISSPIAIIYHNLCVAYYSTSNSNISFSIGGYSYSYSPIDLNINNFHQYVNLAGLIRYYVQLFNFEFGVNYYQAITDYSSSYPYISVQYNGFNFPLYRRTFHTYSYTAGTDIFSTSSVYAYCNYTASIVRNVNDTFRTYLSSNIAYLADTWYRWYCPNISASDSQFWIAFNTDTEVYDHVNLSTVFGYITWYLGQLYIQGNEAAADISQSVSDLSDTLTDFEAKEGQINSSIKSSLNNVDSFFQLPTVTAAGTVIGWLQYMWVSLGTFQAVTIIAWALVILTIVTGFYKVKRITV